ncbi:MAG: D-alanyl-D-alanine carboxypeptidase [Clostridia bacterium]|nr:D-alanyl-D-alanine carboxypeptidase [Clostridia bacterium]
MKYLKSFFCVLLSFVLGFNGILAISFYNEPLNSESVYVVNENTGLSIVEKNIHQKRSPASLTKIMTFIVAYESVPNIADTKVRVRQDVLDTVDPESSGVHLKADEEISVLNLMHCILICSSGYAANVLADYVGAGDINSFVDKMNEKAAEIGCENTHFENPDGIYCENQYSTAFDMYKIAQYARNIPTFNNITSLCEYRCFGDERDPILTTNLTMDSKRGGIYYCPYVKGVKTGYTKEAGRCLISCAENSGMNYVSVVMGGPVEDENGRPIEKNMAMLDTKTVYNWIYKNLRLEKLYPKDFPVAETSLKYVWGADKLLLHPEKDFFGLIPKDFKKEDITLKTQIPEYVEATVKEGDIIGNAEVYYLGERLGSFKLVSPKTYKRNLFVQFLDFCKNLFANPIFMILFVIILILAAFYVIAMLKAARRRRNRRKVRRFRRR